MFLDLTGQRFGKLTVLSEAGRSGSHRTWFCKCDCGNFPPPPFVVITFVKVVRIVAVVRSHTQHTVIVEGCFHRLRIIRGRV